MQSTIDLPQNKIDLPQNKMPKSQNASQNKTIAICSRFITKSNPKMQNAINKKGDQPEQNKVKLD